MGYQKPERTTLIDGDALRRDLSALARAQPDKARLQKEALETLKAELQAARADIQHRFEAGRIESLAAARALSDIQDVVVQVLYDLVSKHFYYAQNPTQAERIAIIATGGYGRRELAPQSDIDLLFLRPYKQTAWGESVIEFILQMLWDMGLKVGHATRSLDECIRLAKQDITIRTAILEARYVWGEHTLFEELRRRFRTEVAAGTALHFVSAKLAERGERHFRQGESRYLVEPNLKEGKGGLRDLQTLYWIGKYLYGVDDPAELVQHNVFTREEYLVFQRAEAFLWQVRFHLHYLTGRPEERLSFDVQPELARRFGYGGSQRESMERFMRRYFLVAKDVGDLTRIFCAALEAQNQKAKPPVLSRLTAFLKVRSTDPFIVENGRLNAKPEIFRQDPANLLRIFAEADERGVDVHPAALREITRSLDLIDDTLRSDPEANRIFLGILTSRRDPEKTLRWLNESGVFGRFVPEFGRVVGLMQFNMYHHYTVDEHLIRAVGNIAAIERGALKSEHPLASELVPRLKSRATLYVATLLHDIAKGLAGDHSDEGANIAVRLCPRWGMSAEETESVIWLVRNHLVMSDTAQRRDIGDPKTVRDFVEKVQSPELLRLLLVLTVADIRAVGPGVWNGWKGQLLRELYQEAEAAMTGREGIHGRQALIEETKAALAKRVADLPETARVAALARHSDAYWMSFDAATHERHARLVHSLQGSDEPLALIAESNTFRAITDIALATADRPGLFSALAGGITASGGSIVDAKIFTTTDGLALDIFSVQDAEGGPFGDPSRIERLRANLLRTLAGEITPRAAEPRSIARKRAGTFQVRPRVRFDNSASAVATIVEVEAADRPGLLYDITRALFESGLSISSAMVATYGEKAVDVFYVRDAYGHKVTHKDRLKSIEGYLLARLESVPLEAATA
ncbi:MAG TPA: [protein-PII] uridylyltransferase [Rhizomicrobium sp.]